MPNTIYDKIDDIFYQKFVRSLLFNSRLGRRSIMGYADSGINFDHIYSNKAKGYTPFGKVVDRVLLNFPACKATRHRFSLITEIIKNEIERNRIRDKVTRIVDLASGPARYLTDILDEKTNGAEGLCFDIDHRALNYGKKLSGQRPLLFKRGNALSVGKHLKKISHDKQWRPNLVLASGFYEYQPDEIVKKHFSSVYDYLESGGLFLAILQYKNPSRTLMEKVGKKKDGKQWILYYRTPAMIEKWFNLAKFYNVEVNADKWNHYVFCLGRKHG